MNLLKLAAMLSLTGFAASVMANEVNISNTSTHTIPVRYQLTYHNAGQAVVLKEVSETVLPGHSNIRVDVPQGTYEHAGITILSVKLPNGKWATLPESARQFDGSPGCWMSTNAHQSSGQLNLAEHLSSTKHGRISCQALPQ